MIFTPPKKMNVFVKPNEQNKVYLDYAMARKGQIKSNICSWPAEAMLLGPHKNRVKRKMLSYSLF